MEPNWRGWRKTREWRIAWLMLRCVFAVDVFFLIVYYILIYLGYGGVR